MNNYVFQQVPIWEQQVLAYLR